MQLATCEKLVDDARVIITRWTLPVGTETGHHVHQYNYVVVYLAGGILTVATPDGEATESPVAQHAVASRLKGVSHNVLNLHGDTVQFLEIEIK
jgi:quercetin dioxygenase-like cupin family protein